MLNIEKPYYKFEASPDALVFEFESVSEKEIIKKIVVYEAVENYKNIFQLGFGNLTKEGGIDFVALSKNKDRDKVLATVAQTMLIFFEQYPTKKIYFTGSDEIRTRFYRSIFSKFIEIIELYFEVIGLGLDGKREKFIKNKAYKGFIIYTK